MRDGDEEGSSVIGLGATEPSALAADASKIRVFDPAAFVAALDEDDEWDDGGYVGPSDERPQPRSRTVEEEMWARLMRKIAADPRRGYRRLLVGDEEMASRLRHATAPCPHFNVVTGIIERAVLASAQTGTPVRFPPVCLLSEAGVGKGFYVRSVSGALGTTTASIALNATSDRGQLSGASPMWRGAKLGRLAKTIIFECETASPLYLLDEIDKCTSIAGENVATVLLSVLERENAMAFVDEYVDVPIRLDLALFLTSANDTESIAPPLLSRMVVVEIAPPTEAQARIIIASIAENAVGRALEDDAIALLVGLSARKARQAIELAFPVTVCAGRATISVDDVRLALEVVEGTHRRRPVGFTG